MTEGDDLVLGGVVLPSGFAITPADDKCPYITITAPGGDSSDLTPEQAMYCGRLLVRFALAATGCEGKSA